MDKENFSQMEIADEIISCLQMELINSKEKKLCDSDELASQLLESECCLIMRKIYEVELAEDDITEEHIDKNIKYVILQLFQETGKKNKLEKKYTAEEINNIFYELKSIITKREVKGKNLSMLKQILERSKDVYETEKNEEGKDYEFIGNTDRRRRSFHKKKLKQFLYKCIGEKYKKRFPKRDTSGKNVVDSDEELLFEGEILPYILLFIVYHHAYYQKRERYMRKNIVSQITGKRKDRTDCVCVDEILWVIGCLSELINHNFDILDEISIKLSCVGLNSFFNKFNFIEKHISILQTDNLLKIFTDEGLVPSDEVAAKMGTFMVAIECAANETSGKDDCRIVAGLNSKGDLSGDYSPLIKKLEKKLSNISNTEIREYLNKPSGKDDIGINIKNQLISMLYANLDLDNSKYLSIFVWILVCVQIIRSSIWSYKYETIEEFLLEANNVINVNFKCARLIVETSDLMCGEAKKIYERIFVDAKDDKNDYENILLKRALEVFYNDSPKISL